MIAPSFLIDECLSRALCGIAHQHGYAAHALVDLGGAGLKDWDMMKIASEHDFVLVTNNVIDFLALYALRQLHPGVVLLKGRILGRDAQCRAFAAALDDIDADPDTVNQAIEIMPGELPQWSVQRYPLQSPLTSRPATRPDRPPYPFRPITSRPISMRRTSEVPAPIS